MVATDEKCLLNYAIKFHFYCLSSLKMNFKTICEMPQYITGMQQKRYRMKRWEISSQIIKSLSFETR